MRAIFVLFDTLNRHNLEPYGGTDLETPNFRRLAERSVRFDRHYVGSLPCMPARRDLQTGRLNFLHRSWGPLEPFDEAMPRILKKSGVYSHMITDHYHYLEPGGAGYLNTYSSFEMLRGQEGDLWKAEVDPPLETWRQTYHKAQYSETPGDLAYHNMVNRGEIRDEGDFSSVQCFDLGCAFLDRNHAADNWFLQIETFDPHEPFHAPERLKQRFQTGWNGPVRDWPPYARVTEEAGEADELRANYKALLAHCDEQLGRLLDKMDALGMWEDTMLIVSTDHGYLTGEHGWWAKNRMPAYQEIAHIPLFIHHPAHADRDGSACETLSYTPDLMPTLLDAFGCAIPESVRGKSLFPALRDPAEPGHEAVIYGYFGGAVNVTDGRYTYFRYPEDLLKQELNQYTLMPSHMLVPFGREELQGATLVTNLAYADGVPVLRVPVLPESAWYQSHGPAVMEQNASLLYDVQTDPAQLSPLDDPEVEARLSRALCEQMQRHDAPPEAFGRLGLTPQET
ncbi:sulfatase [Frigidibacter sp. ROC022]|uniref:sulfatase n=1 Tax=Frigidibacter sp. ROC022 TaxID=2971796 RepID=UPI00215A84A0|nr:sulfatase [Frigidibacter sp. ROC022]MCR8723738.1 sulfatase [Frigidibacter sp. ROC022]